MTHSLEVRRLSRIGAQVNALKERLPHADVNLLTAFARGHQSLAAYKDLLSPKGHRLLDASTQVLERPSIEEIERLTPELPSVKKPRLGLYLKPFTQETLDDPDFRAFRLAFNHRGGYSIIQIATGCANNCLMCGADAERKIRFMPYPMVLLLAKQLIDKGSPAKILFYEGNDVLQWRDANFDADFGDLVLQLKQMEIPFAPQVTHGFWPGDRYAEEAAKKCVEAGVSFLLSVHLFHKEILSSPDAAPNEEYLQRYADRFARSMTMLPLYEITLLSDLRNANKYLHLEYLSEFYTEGVFPMLPEKIRGRSKKYFGLEKIEMPSVAAEGRAYGSPYFVDLGRRELSTSIHPSEVVRKVDPDGVVKLSYRAEGLLPPKFSPSQTIGERFSDPCSREFERFLYKLRFALLFISRGKGKQRVWKSVNLKLWRRYFPGFEAGKVLRLLRLFEDSHLTALRLREQVKDLPVISEEFHYDVKVENLREEGKSLAQSPFEKYLYSLFGKCRIEEEFLASFVEGKQALEKMKSNFMLWEAIVAQKCSEEQLAEAFEILKDLPILLPTRILKLPQLRTKTVMPFRARVAGIL